MEEIIRQSSSDSEHEFFHFGIASDDNFARKTIQIIRPVMENVIENHYGALRFVENVILRFLVDFP